jgi:SAM-dependent methyltransferase
MAIERNCATLMLKARRDGVAFGRSLMLGHQGLGLARGEYETFQRLTGAAIQSPTPVYADELFRSLGATRVDVMDFSDYEGANLLHDLNQPIAEGYRAAFDVVVDGGTLEHVFNFPIAMRNCMEMVRPGGHFFSATIPNNWCGHGFYQFSPELFFRVLSPENGYRVEGMYLAELDGSRWWSIRDPAEARSRVELVNDRPVFLLVRALREAVVPIFARTPQQSDYVTAWTGSGDEDVRASWKTRLRRLPLIRTLDRIHRRRRERRWASVANTDLYTPFDPGFRL